MLNSIVGRTRRSSRIAHGGTLRVMAPPTEGDDQAVIGLENVHRTLRDLETERLNRAGTPDIHVISARVMGPGREIGVAIAASGIMGSASVEDLLRRFCRFGVLGV